MEDYLRRNMENIVRLRAQIKDLEIENNNLVLENEDLRQASLDGIEIAKQVDRLTREREGLSIDLADKASQIKKLLSDNQILHNKLRQAQSEAQNLIRMSQVPTA